MEITVQGPSLDQGQASVCAPILRALPAWFGIEEATAQYIRDIEKMPTLLAVLQATGDVVGFLTLNYHTAYAAEIHVMGVLPSMHRRGVGRALVARAEEVLRGEGIEYLQVKTLSPRRESEEYARTREFYLAMGFRPLQEFPELWGPENPCLQMIKRLD
jgi:N-acetylglutamate synthase-like GNAT family acetyltransferase